MPKEIQEEIRRLQLRTLISAKRSSIRSRLSSREILCSRHGSLSQTQLNNNLFRGANRPCPGLTSAGPNTTNSAACGSFEQIGKGGVRIVRQVGGPTAAVFNL